MSGRFVSRASLAAKVDFPAPDQPVISTRLTRMAPTGSKDIVIQVVGAWVYPGRNEHRHATAAFPGIDAKRSDWTRQHESQHHQADVVRCGSHVTWS